MRTPRAYFKLLGVVAVIVLTWEADKIYHQGIQNGNASALGQLGSDTSRALESYYASNNSYPHTLEELPVSFGDGSTREDLQKATYFTEGAMAVVILERPESPSVLVVLKMGKLEGNIKFLSLP